MSIKILDNKPQCFNDIPDTAPHIWMQGNNNQCTYAYAALAFSKPVATLHLKVISWSASVLKHLKEDFDVVVTMCRERGATEILIINPDPDDKWFKFIKNFGFDKPMGVARMRI